LVKRANGYDIPTDCRERPLGRPTERQLGRHRSTNGYRQIAGNGPLGRPTKRQLGGHGSTDGYRQIPENGP